MPIVSVAAAAPPRLTSSTMPWVSARMTASVSRARYSAVPHQRSPTSSSDEATKRAAKPSASRTEVERRSLSIAQPIADAAHRVQQSRLEPGIDLLPEPAYMHVYDIGLRVEMVLPHVFEQHRAGHHLAGMAHQVFEQFELAPLQLDLPAAARDPMRQEVDAQVGDGQHGLDRRAVAAPRQGLEPGQQLAEGERLGQVVVAAGAQPADAVVDLGERAQDQDRRPVAGVAQRLDDAEPVDAARQHAVEDQHVVLAGGGEIEPVAAVVGMVDRVAFLEQPLAYELG